MNARKAVLADNPELILRVLQLRFDESLSYPRISAQTGISKTAIFSLVRRFHQVFTDWPLSGEYSCVQLARALFPGRYPSAPTVTQTVKTEKTRRNQFSPEFKWRLVQQTLLNKRQSGGERTGNMTTGGAEPGSSPPQRAGRVRVIAVRVQPAAVQCSHCTDSSHIWQGEQRPGCQRQ